MRWIFVLTFLCIDIVAGEQVSNGYTTGNAHSHNDYRQARPFSFAYENGFGSIEADIFLRDSVLIVAHSEDEIDLNNLLRRLYLDPLLSRVREHHGYPYADTAKVLQLLVDIKTEAVSTMARLVNVLELYPDLVRCKKILFTISGNRPEVAAFKNYPAYIMFDGEFGKSYPAESLARLPLFSADFAEFSSWKGKGAILNSERKVLDSLVNVAHGTGRKVRFWNAPDFPEAWQGLMNLKVDYLNTDHIAELSKLITRS